MYYRLTLALLQRGFLRMGTRFWLLLGSVAACTWLLKINLSPVFGAVTFDALVRDQAVHRNTYSLPPVSDTPACSVLV